MITCPHKGLLLAPSNDTDTTCTAPDVSFKLHVHTEEECFLVLLLQSIIGDTEWKVDLCQLSTIYKIHVSESQ